MTEPSPSDLLADFESELLRAARRLFGDDATARVNAFRQAIAPSRDALEKRIHELAAEARLARLALDLAALAGEAPGAAAFATAALRAIAPLVRASRAWAVALDDEGEQARLVAELKADAPVASDAADAAEPAPLLSRSLLQQLVRERKPVVIGDAREATIGTETSIIRQGVRSAVVVPLLRDGRVHAALGAENVSFAGAFTDADVQLLERAAALLSPFLLVHARIDRALDEVTRLKTSAPGGSQEQLIGESAAVKKLRLVVAKVGDSDAPTMIEGESGSGKELVARALHAASKRSGGPFITVNCAAIPEGLLESELFGHEKGAFTGATERKKGRFEQADGGTLFLDEIGEMRTDLQAKLLRVLQDQTFERVGGSTPLKVDVRVVAATHRDLRKLVADGRFREDLFYRIHVVPIVVPPLRERGEDIPLLARHFLASAARQLGRPLEFDPAALEVLSAHSFPGNVRELKNLVMRLAVLADGSRVGVADLPDEIAGPRTASLDKDPLRGFLRRDVQTADELKDLLTQMSATLETYSRQVEARFYRGLVERAGGSVSEAARMGGVNRTFLHKKLKELEGE